MRLPRASGVLLHPTALPGAWGIGDIGPAAFAFVDWLAAARQRCWQVLPLGPTSFGDSPYQSPSTFAGNPLLISPEALAAAALLDAADLDALARPPGRVDYGAVIAARLPVLRRAARRACATVRWRDEIDRFRAAEGAWLEDFALFMALKEAHGGAPWWEWPPPLRLRAPEAIARARAELGDAIAEHVALQWLFFTQWAALHRHAAAAGVRLVGDLPIFVARDSADVWAARQLFQLDADGTPTVVAGVPPDYFSETGQLWGNPLYAWEAHAADGFAWWIARLRAAFARYDCVRIDHFIGFTRYWAVPAGETTAMHGEWRPSPGAAVLAAARAALGELAIIAEDLGSLTPQVDALRRDFALPGMQVLQFAFDSDASNRYLPHNYEPHCVVYTGTHDNDTTAGWLATAPPAVRTAVQRYTGCREGDLVAALVRLAFASVADTAIIPAQDILGLDRSARMNEPGNPLGNWSWRLRDGELGPVHAEHLAELSATYGRDQKRDR